MLPFRRSLSIPKLHHRGAAIDTQSQHGSQKGSREDENLLQSASSAFVIPSRTRYPSSQVRKPETLDIHVAQNLLNMQDGPQHSETTRRMHVWDNKENRPQIDNSDDRDGLCRRENSSAGPLSLSSTQLNSHDASCWSSTRIGSHVHFSSTSGSEKSSFRDARHYATAYNQLARKHGLRDLQVLFTSSTSESDAVQCRTNAKPSKHNAKNWLFSKLTRNASTKTLRRSGSQLSRKGSLSSLLSHQPRITLKNQSLEDICRLGGISVLDLPAKYAAIRLEMPTGLAATANYIIIHGRDCPGIFRVPGQMSLANAIYDHYIFRIQDAENLGSVETTVGSLSLPPGMSPSVHDVASAFKKFLWDLPGGILGSAVLFEALKDICELPTAKPDSRSSDRIEREERTKLVALAIISLNSTRRISLICAVFGLLAFLKRDRPDASSASPSRQLGPESMSSHALGVVFAPLLLGNLTEPLDLQVSSSANGGVYDSQPTPKKGTPFHKKTPKPLSLESQNDDMAVGFAKAKTCASITSLLVGEWEDIVAEIRSLSRATVKSDDELRHLTATRLRTKSSDGLDPAIHEENDRILHTPEPLCTPHSAWTAGRFKPLPYPPTPSLDIFGDLRKTPPAYDTSRKWLSPSKHLLYSNDSKYGRRSNLVLQMSDPVYSRSTPFLSQEGNNFISPSGHRSAFWSTHETTQRSEQSRGNSLSLDNGTATNLEDRDLSSRGDEPTNLAIVGAGGLSSSDVDPRSRSSLPENYTAIDGTPTSHENAEGCVDEMLNNERADAVSVEDNGANIGDGESNWKQNPTSPHDFANCTVFNTEHTPTPVRRITKYSPSMIPRPINEPLRSGSSKYGNSEATKPFSHYAKSLTAASECRFLPRDGDFSRNSSPHRTASDLLSVGRKTQAKTKSASSPHVPEPRVCEGNTARKLTSRNSPREGNNKTPTKEKSPQHIPARLNEHKPNVGTLYAEVRRLHSQLCAKDDEIAQLKQHINVLKRLQDSETLSKKLQDSDQDMRMWQCRARWAEAELLTFKNKGRQAGQEESKGMDQQEIPGNGKHDS